MATISLYSLSTKEELQKQFVGKSLKDVAPPAVVLDVSKIKTNCKRMLDAVAALEFGWRAHIKTHKTTEVTRLQVGEDTGPVNIIVSTLIEAECVLPLLLEYKAAGRAVNVLYSFPVTPAAVERLSLISTALGPNGLSIMLDHPDQLPSVLALQKTTSIAPLIFLKINMGGNRAGAIPQTETCTSLIKSLLELDASGTATLLGLYSHAGQSYASNSTTSALTYLNQEFVALLETAQEVHAINPSKTLVLSVGATPTTNSVRNLLIQDDTRTPEETTAITTLRQTITNILTSSNTIEIHAGVYPILDVQQLSTHALPTSGPHAQLTWDDLALTILAEVASIYPLRGPNNSTEILIGSGTLALGREPCKAYSGWGVVSPWNRPGSSNPKRGPEDKIGWYVGRTSQEHGILSWSGEEGKEEKLEVGQLIRVWPNHACIAGPGFGWYFVVDSTREGREDEIIDVWPRWRGW